jgi:hypothetical protein
MEQTQTPFFHALFKPELRQMFDHKGRKTDKFKLHETGWDAEVHVPKEWVLQAQANHRERPCSLGSLRKDQIFLPHSSWGQWYPPEFHVWMYQGEIFLADNSIVTQTDFETVLSEYRARIQEAEDAAARREEEDALISEGRRQ